MIEGKGERGSASVCVCEREREIERKKEVKGAKKPK